MKINNIILLIAIGALTLSCQGIKDGLSGRKSENSDEFLVQKKNPLILPPKYLELPKPKDTKDEVEVLQTEEFDIEKMLGAENKSTTSQIEKDGTAEDFVLKNIKNN